MVGLDAVTAAGAATILQRATYKYGLLTIQGVSTCLYLCMDACGFHYANSKESGAVMRKKNQLSQDKNSMVKQFAPYLEILL
ncbi:hypothetical protein KGM_207670 [Danaus plexippus plexippus]|uniref:Uncharacterized protein n=1 Tax=Danaus plexippus plexippus TaxID=278856 RepID=A0A212FDA8_DANPL|nr:hypothetical protein KGM_207670 [Danaus plexippus plexippus]